MSTDLEQQVIDVAIIIGDIGWQHVSLQKADILNAACK